MAERAGDPVALGRVTANREVLARLADGAERSRDGVGPWSPDGWEMRTHPDLTEALEQSAADDLRVVYGVATLVDDAQRIYAVGWGTGGVWLRVPSGPAFDDAVGGDATAVEGLAGWVAVDAWRVDLGQWVRASAALTRDLVPAEPDVADA
jgi:hypothetical protein